MKTWLLMLLMAAMPCTWASVEAISNTQVPKKGKPAVFSFGGEKNRDFMLDGKPFQIRSGEMYPQRTPRKYWRNRIQMAKAMGLNTIAFYVFWNDLEKKDGGWDLSGMRDIGAFIDLCAEEGMWVLFRPGPYTCGEWDLGGLPSRLLAKEGALLRCTKNADFMKEQTRYLDMISKIAIPRLCKNGGPILLVQLENEYGSYNVPHTEQAYMNWLLDYWKRKGAGPFYVSEGYSPHHLRWTPKGVAIGLDPGENDASFNNAWGKNPNVPVFSSETYPGWLRHWGEGNWQPTRKTLNAVRWFMDKGHSFNLFVIHGGTSFALTAGANENKPASYQPDLTSYDYGAPVGENGNITQEYHEYRDIIKAKLPADAKLPEPPATPEAMEIPAFTPELVGALKPKFKKKTFSVPPTLERCGQNQGMACYRAPLPAGPATKLQALVHDLGQVYIREGKGGYKYLGSINRMKQQNSIDLPERKENGQVLILVDTFGHTNFFASMETDRKGILGPVSLGGEPISMTPTSEPSKMPVAKGGKALDGWQVSLLNLQAPAAEVQANFGADGAKDKSLRLKLYKAVVTLDKTADSYLDMTGWAKGYVWVNGHLLGRYWNLGPQLRLYCPAEWFRKGENEILVLDSFAVEPAPISGKTERNMEVLKETHNANNEWD